MIKKIKQIIKSPLIILIRIYFKMRQLYPIWSFLNRRPRKFYKKNLPQLSPVQRQILDELNKSGIAVARLEELFPGENRLALLQKYTEDIRKKAEIKTGKTFLQYLWDVLPVIDFSNPFIEISLHDRILDIVNSYMQMYSRLYYLTLNVTAPVKEGEKAFASQLWHRDPEDKKMLKLFIYLNDVDEDSGPFIYVPYSKYGLKWGGVFPQRPPRGYYPPKGAVEKVIPPDAIRLMTAPAGTMIFCDTTGLHKGGYATKKERIMFTAGYRSQVSAWHTDFKHPQNIEEEMNKKEFNEKKRFAIEYNKTDFSTFLLYWLKGNK